MLYNLQFIQALAALSSKFSPDERQAWSTAGVLKKVTRCRIEFLHSIMCSLVQKLSLLSSIIDAIQILQGLTVSLWEMGTLC